jgi:hypothetical protein
MSPDNAVTIRKDDLQEAWMVLENLAVSFDQIGGAFGESEASPNGADREMAVLKTLDRYITPDLVKKINNARMRLGQYLSDDEAEALSETIPYWDYAGLKKRSEAES